MANTAETMLAKITEQLDAGKTVIFATHCRSIKVTARNYANWKKSGHDLFRVQGNHLCIAAGKRFDSVMGAKIKRGFEALSEGHSNCI